MTKGVEQKAQKNPHCKCTEKGRQGAGREAVHTQVCVCSMLEAVGPAQLHFIFKRIEASSDSFLLVLKGKEEYKILKNLFSIF